MTTHTRAPRVRDTRRVRPIAALAAFATAAAGLTASATAAGATTDPTPETAYGFAADVSSIGSLGFTAWSMEEFGKQIELGGEARGLDSVTVALQSYACADGSWNKADCLTEDESATWSHPITVNVYGVPEDGVLDESREPIATITETVEIPFRPSADVDVCTEADGKLGYYWDEENARCATSIVHEVTLDFSTLGVALPDEVVVGVHAPTSRFYSDLYPAGGYYDSLNVALTDVAPVVGTDPFPERLYFDSTYASAFYTGDRTATHGLFQSSNGWYGEGEDGWYYNPLISVATVPVAQQAAAVYGFETAADVADSDNGLPNVTIVETSAEMPAAAGCYYAVAPQNPAGDDYVYQFTRFGGYTSVFPTDGWTTSADFYLDTAVDTGDSLNQFDWSVAANGTDGAHERDFIFHAQSAGAGSWTLGASNNSGHEGVGVGALSGDTFEITESGWYTVSHTFADVDGVLSVDISVADAEGSVLKTWTRSNEGDVINLTVGGSRYGWLVVNGFDALPIDNVTINAERPTEGCAPADFTALDAALVTAGELVEEHYTTDSFAAVVAAVAGAGDVEGAFVFQQDEVDAATAAITAAIDALELLPADVAQLELALIAAGEVDRDGRTPESLDLLDAAVIIGNGALDATIVEQDQVDAAVAVIEAAIEALDYLPANIDALNAAIAAAEAADRDGRTSASLAALDSAVDVAQGLLGANITAQDQVAAAAAAVLEAIDGLAYRPADTTALAAVLDKIDAVNLAKYTKPTVARVTAALVGAEDLLDADIRAQAAVDAKATKLQRAFTALVRIPTFSDIATSPFKTHIQWLAAEGVTTGYADGTYRPLGSINRDALAAFLYRWAGSPEFTAPATSPFADVSTSHPFYKEISWLAAEGISTGWSVSGGKEFRPYEPIDRNAMAAFLFRFADVKGYAAPSTSPFLDVAPGDKFYKEMAWLAEAGISTGWSVSGGKEFRADESITREAMAAFLYRMSA